MTKEEVDKAFTERYSELLKIAKGMLVKARKNYEVEGVVAEAYLHVQRDREQLAGPEMVGVFAIKYMRDEIKWTESGLNRREKLASVDMDYVYRYNQDLEDRSRLTNFEKLELIAYRKDLQDYESKVETERRETAIKVLIQHYAATEKNILKRKVFEVYGKGANTCRRMADVFGISKTRACQMLEEMYADVQSFADANGYLRLN